MEISEMQKQFLKQQSELGRRINPVDTFDIITLKLVIDPTIPLFAYYLKCVFTGKIEK